jgi:hypothetical protein
MNPYHIEVQTNSNIMWDEIQDLPSEIFDITDEDLQQMFEDTWDEEENS